jgi:transposase
MELPRKAQRAEELRLRAVLCVEEGELPQDVARWLEVSERTLWRWLSAWRAAGGAAEALARKRPPGRPRKLTAAQERQVLSWFGRSPCAFGFATERWTAPRVAELIRRRFGVRMNARYLCDWLGRRGISPQIPQRVPRERDQAAIDAWVAHRWPRIKKSRGSRAPAWFSRTKAAFCSRRCCAGRWRRSGTPRCSSNAPATATRSQRPRR